MENGEPRATKDLDIFYPIRRRKRQSGISRSHSIRDLTPADFMDGTTFQIGQPPARIDILQQIDGITLDEAWANRIQGLINRQIQAAVISRDDLIPNKLATGATTFGNLVILSLRRRSRQRSSDFTPKRPLVAYNTSGCIHKDGLMVLQYPSGCGEPL